jgi:23S rRNA pseudouridine1911/1915/1917 synthase
MPKPSGPPDRPSTPTDLGPREVPRDLGGQRLDAIVRALYGFTWNQARDWVATGKVQVDGETVLEGSARPPAGLELTLHPNARKPRPLTELAPDSIVLVDRHVVVVNKPSGVSTMPFEDFELGTLQARVVDFLARHGDASGPNRGRPSLSVVHRLDRLTSGLLVFARTRAAAQALGAQFRAHTVHRRYLALVNGRAENATYRSNLIADRGDGLRGSREALPRGRKAHGDSKLAVTHVTVMERLGEVTLVACQLETGRTHQIRIHLAEAGHPLVGERVYVKGYRGPLLRAERTMLHAAELGFLHPASGLEMRFTRALPEDMQGLVDRLRTRSPEA